MRSVGLGLVGLIYLCSVKFRSLLLSVGLVLIAFGGIGHILDRSIGLVLIAFGRSVGWLGRSYSIGGIGLFTVVQSAIGFNMGRPD